MQSMSVLKCACIMVVVVVIASCSSSRYQDGFSYKPAYAGPDMGSTATGNGTTEESSQPITQPSPIAEKLVTITSQPEHELNGQTGLSGQLQVYQSETDLLLGIAAQTARERSAAAPTSFRNSVRKMADLYAEKSNTVYTEKQLKKLDKIALKLEKKQQRQAPNVQWGPANNLEWAILGAAAVGLFVGIFGIGFGWFIFLIAALAYLYFKLLHNN